MKKRWDELKKIMDEQKPFMDYDCIHSNDTVKKLLYSFVDIQHEQTPFDYFDSIWLEDDASFGASIFIEPVGNVGFKGETMEQFFIGLNNLFNSQPPHTKYALAGHQIQQYGRSIRKGKGIDFRYLDVEQVWSIDINEEDEKTEFEKIKKGRDVFDYISQKNRLPIAILDGICFMNDGLEDLMMGEMIHVEAYMPDFFKVIVDLSNFEEHNQYILGKCSDMFKDLYPKNRIMEYYLSYEDNVEDLEEIQILKEEDIPHIMAEAKKYWESGYDDGYLEYRKDTKIR